MKISLNWLNELANLQLTPKEVETTLVELGLEIEGMESTLKPFSGVVLGHILEAKPHPNADRLQVLRVDAGQPQELNIVCGAPNARPGLAVPVALDGADLAGQKLKCKKVRGVFSEGMICSEAELGFAEHSEGIWEVRFNEAPGTDFRSLFHEDTLLEISIGPNRGDCLGLRGLLRELGLKHPTTPLKIPDHPPLATSPQFGLNIEDHDCSRYSLAIYENVRVTESEEWLQQRLTDLGVRPINNIVDMTNYVMLLCGHPLHAFDCDRLQGETLLVRSARDGETLQTLDGVTRNLQAEDLVIADSKHPVALAGVMGGEHSSIGKSTHRVAVEVACFDDIRIRKMAKRHKMHTDASHRFERGMDPDSTLDGLALMHSLLIQSGAQFVEAQEQRLGESTPTHIRLRYARISKILGVRPPQDWVIGTLQKLGMEILEKNQDDTLVKVPGYRTDLSREVDLIEEIARIYGFDAIPFETPMVSLKAEEPLQDLRLLDRVRDELVKAGLQEALTLSFSSQGNENALQLSNPLNEDASYLRQEIYGNLLESFLHNARHQSPDVGLFEIGKVFHTTEPQENYHLCVLLSGELSRTFLQGANKATFHHLKGILLQLFENLGILCEFKENRNGSLYPQFLNNLDLFVQGQAVGTLGLINPGDLRKSRVQDSVAVVELNLSPLLHVQARKLQITPSPAYPGVERQLSMLCPNELPAAEVLRQIKGLKLQSLKESTIFDLYTGKGLAPGMKSLGINLFFQDDTKTLRDAEIEADVNRILERLQQTLQIQLR